MVFEFFPWAACTWTSTLLMYITKLYAFKLSNLRLNSSWLPISTFTIPDLSK